MLIGCPPSGWEILKCAIHRGFPLQNLVSNHVAPGTWDGAGVG